MSDDAQRPIIVKRVKKGGHRHHGGAWKIAYADFVTAMMAFFLLMWLLGSTTKGDLEGIAEYFKTPMKVAMQGGTGTGDSSSVIRGGGKDLSQKVGQVQKSLDPVKKQAINLKAVKEEFQIQELKKLKGLKEKLEKAIESNPMLQQFKKQILIDITTEGLRIQIVDEKNRPMFDLGSAHLKSYTTQILHEIGIILNEVPNRLSLSGHTDATPYSSGEKGYSNWELSADRANSSRRELIAGGMAEGKILRVVGLASAIMLDNNDPFNPINRRISLIVLNKETEDAIIRGDKALEVSNQAQASSGLEAVAKANPEENPSAVTAEVKKR
jgi:chemotaxis protein MotB